MLHPITARLTAEAPMDLKAIWETVKYGLSWFFGNMVPAALWGVVALAICIAFFVYYWRCLKPRPRTLEWITMAEKRARPRQMTLTLKRHPLTRRDIAPILIVTILYAATAFFRLGSFTAPQTCTVCQYELAPALEPEGTEATEPATPDPTASGGASGQAGSDSKRQGNDGGYPGASGYQSGNDHL